MIGRTKRHARGVLSLFRKVAKAHVRGEAHDQGDQEGFTFDKHHISQKGGRDIRKNKLRQVIGDSSVERKHGGGGGNGGG